jgi:hypothetical protein
MTDPQDGARPLLRVVRGTPTDEELAALTAVLATLKRAPEPVTTSPRPRSRWADRPALMRRVLSPGPGAWRASAWPRSGSS